MSNLPRVVIDLNSWPSNSNSTLHCHWSAFKTTTGHSLTPQTFALLPEMACCCFESRPMTMQRVIRMTMQRVIPTPLLVCTFRQDPVYKPTTCTNAHLIPNISPPPPNISPLVYHYCLSLVPLFITITVLV